MVAKSLSKCNLTDLFNRVYKIKLFKRGSWVIIWYLYPPFLIFLQMEYVWQLMRLPASLPTRRMLTNSTRATCLSSLPWRLSTPCPRPATSGEAQSTKGTRRILTGLKALKRKPCSRAGREPQTTAPSPPCSDLQTAPPAQSGDTPTTGQGTRPPFDLIHYCITNVTKTSCVYELGLL